MQDFTTGRGPPCHEPDLGDNIKRPYAVHGQGEGRRKCRRVYRISKTIADRSETHDLSDRRSRPRASGAEDQGFCQNSWRKTDAVLPAAIFTRSQSRRTRLETSQG